MDLVLTQVSTDASTGCVQFSSQVQQRGLHHLIRLRTTFCIITRWAALSTAPQPPENGLDWSWDFMEHKYVWCPTDYHAADQLANIWQCHLLKLRRWCSFGRCYADECGSRSRYNQQGHREQTQRTAMKRSKWFDLRTMKTTVSHTGTESKHNEQLWREASALIWKQWKQ
jgi:hypothetical protein